MLVQLHLDLWSICSLFFSLVWGMDLIFSKWLPSCPKTIFYKWPPFSSNLRYLLYHTLDVYMQLGLFLDFPGYFFDLFVYSCANAAPFNYRGLVVCLIIWLDWFSSELFLVSLFLTILVSLFFPVNFKIVFHQTFNSWFCLFWRVFQVSLLEALSLGLSLPLPHENGCSHENLLLTAYITACRYLGALEQ